MKKLLIIVPMMVVIFAGCGESGGKSDIKNNFCGVHIQTQYCKCAFHGEMCEDVGMNKAEAKKYVYEQYEQWNNGGKEKWAEECKEKNGVFFGNTCMKCGAGEVATDTKCVPKEQVVVDEQNTETEQIENEQEQEPTKTGDCKYDSDCDAMCEGNVAWKMGCNPRTGECVKTFDTNCAGDVEVFGDLNFPKLCSDGKCVRDTESINQMKKELQNLKDESISDAKLTVAQRQELTELMLEANKNCLNGLADMTNVAIVELGTRLASLMAGGLPSLADASVDYVNDAINKLTAQNTPTDTQKLKPDEYIALNCGLYNHFKNYLILTGDDLDNEIDNAQEINDVLQLLP